jgi:hypothetical protein
MYRLFALLCLALPLAAQAHPNHFADQRTHHHNRHDHDDDRVERRRAAKHKRHRRAHKVVVDQRAMDRQLRKAHRELEELDRIIARLRRAHTRHRLAEQVDELRERLVKMEKMLDSADRYRPAPKRPVKRRPKALSDADFAKLERSVRRAPFRDDKLRVVRHAARYHRFTSAQAYALARRMLFGDDKVDALVALHPRVVDPQNFHIAYRALNHSSDRRDLDKRLYAAR